MPLDASLGANSASVDTNRTENREKRSDMIAIAKVRARPKARPSD